MSVTRLNFYRARAGQDAALRDFLASILLILRSMDGCESAYVLENTDDPAAFILAEVWTSADLHRESVKSIPAETVSLMSHLVEAAPIGGYYTVTGG